MQRCTLTVILNADKSSGTEKTHRKRFNLSFHQNEVENDNSEVSDEDSRPQFSDIKKVSGYLDRELEASGFTRKDQDDIEKFIEGDVEKGQNSDCDGVEDEGDTVNGIKETYLVNFESLHLDGKEGDNEHEDSYDGCITNQYTSKECSQIGHQPPEDRQFEQEDNAGDETQAGHGSDSDEGEHNDKHYLHAHVPQLLTGIYNIRNGKKKFGIGNFGMSAEREGFIRTLHQTLSSCSGLIEAGDYINSEKSILELVHFLDSISNSLEAGVENEESERTAIEILEQIHQYVCSPSLTQEVIDALAFELPKAVAKFGCVSRMCLEVAEMVINRFVDRCSPRDMLSIFCEALGSPSEKFTVSGYFILLLSGLSKVLVLLQRRHYEQVNAAVPVVLNVLQTMSSQSDGEYADYEDLFYKATDIANSIQAICIMLEGKDNHKLHALLGLYVLQSMALVSIGMRSELSCCIPVVVRLSNLLQHCELSYIGLITGYEVDAISKLVLEDGDDNNINCFSQARLGASLAVIWGYNNSEVSGAAKADLTSVKLELQGNWIRRWEALGMLKYIFSCAKVPWELKNHAIGFIQCIMDGRVSPFYDDHLDYMTHMPTFYTSLQAIQMVIMYASDAVLRTNAFTAFKMVLSDIPTSPRFDVLRALIRITDSSSMVAILIDRVKEEMVMGRTDRNSRVSFWSPSVLELVEVVLRPPQGGPPSLPHDSDAVLSALNIYRFILITESTGNSNCTGVLSKDNLYKAYNEWLLPLRTLVTRTAAETQKDCDVLATDAICALNPVELVLYRCIELVEEELKHL